MKKQHLRLTLFLHSTFQNHYIFLRVIDDFCLFISIFDTSKLTKSKMLNSIVDDRKCLPDQFISAASIIQLNDWNSMIFSSIIVCNNCNRTFAPEYLVLVPFFIDKMVYLSRFSFFRTILIVQNYLFD